MTAELSPEEALRIAVETRRSAAPPRVPRWFPGFMGASFGLAMAAVGVSDLVGRNQAAASACGIAGIVLLVAHFAVYAELVRRWRRGGLVPLSDTCATRSRRRASRWFLLAAVLVAGAFYLAGSPDWGNVSFGVIIGVETWYRLTGWTKP
ncbi:hypothetical protein [Streptacidiphilus melanogenes]|uniref:hypothetical protein n=1 Tax=Streptacidiphilus melanogenes TaxID=411235 RepID=UPI0005A9A482|nr:hypothetical protein [Streptacidiphilus melanogenes]